MNIIARRPTGIEIYPFQAAGTTESTPVKVPAQSCITSADGTRLYTSSPEAVHVLDSTSGSKVSSLPVAGVLFTALSPLGTYLVVVQRPSLENGVPAKNLQVWHLADAQCVLSINQKAVGKDTWPLIHWAPDEEHLFHMLTSMVHIYTRADGFAAYRKLPVKGITGLAVSPAAGTARLATFVPEAKSVPGVAAIYDYSNPASTEPLLRKSFFRCQGSTLLWNSVGTALLALASSDFDATNQSYYGEQKLHFMPSEASRADAACLVPLPKEGPVHDVQWTPAGDFFAVIAGFMPARVTLFDANCKAVFDFGTGPYNMLRWSPFSRLLAVAGFGNLPGDILFFEKRAGGVCKQVAAVRNPAVSAEWSPDGRHLMVATTAPRLRVDNSYKVFDYCGHPVAQANFDVLLEATWLPAAPAAHADRPLSPSRLATATGGGTSSAPVAGPAKAAAAYRPPGSRGTIGEGQTGGVVGGFDPAGAHGKFQAAVASRQKQPPPGAEAAPAANKVASKNAKKRAAAKKKGGGEGGAEGEAEGDEGAGEAEAGPASSPAAEAPATSTSAPDVGQLSLQAGGAAEGGADDIPKRIRALQKKLRQIEQIKDKSAKQGESSLEPEQRSKLAAEPELLKELHSIGGAL